MTAVRSSLVVLALMLVASSVEAQSASIAFPGLLVTDYDGKILGRVVGFERDSNFPIVSIVANDQPVRLKVPWWGPIALRQVTVFFDSVNCHGNAYTPELQTADKAWYSMGEPLAAVVHDQVQEEYRLYVGDPNAAPIYVTWASQYSGGGCLNTISSDFMIPMPDTGLLDGYRASVEVSNQWQFPWQVRGGDTITQPSP